MSDLSRLVVESGGDHVQRVNHDGHHEPREERPGQVGQPGAALEAGVAADQVLDVAKICLLYTSPSPRDGLLSRMPSSA